MFDARTKRRKADLLKKQKNVKKASEMSGSQLSIALRRFIKNRAGLIGLFFTVLIFFIAIFADVISPYPPLEMNAINNYVPWYLPPGNVEGRIPPEMNQIMDGSFGTAGIYWNPSPGWSYITNLTSEGVPDTYGSSAYRASTGGMPLTQTFEVDEDVDMLMCTFSFYIYLNGTEAANISVTFEFEDGNDEITINYEILASDSFRWVRHQDRFYVGTERSPDQIKVKIINPTSIAFSKSIFGSIVYIDQVRLDAGEYFSRFHILGTNWRSHDLYSKLIYGSRVSLIVSIGAIFLSIFIGLPLGLIAGYYRGRTDEIIMRITDIFLTLPFYFVMILVIALMQDNPSLDNLIISLRLNAEVIIVAVTLGLGLFGWMGITRLVRATILQIREMDYVEAARCLGASNRRIMLVHILPNILAPLLVVVTFNLAVNIVAEAGLSFLGFTDVSLASWGRELDDGTEIVSVAWWPILFPALFIIISVMSFNLLGDGLRDAFDPRLR